MKKIYFLSVVLVSSLFFGCSMKEVKLPEVHLKKSTPKAYSCDEEHFVKHYNRNNLHKIANKYFIYALFSSNNYDNNTYFSVPNWERVKRYTSTKGFSADIYEKTINSKIEEVVISFRGTDDYFGDWFFANLSVTKGGQYEQARELFELISKDYKSVKKTVTGHSLGGGLALHISSRYNNVNAFVFDNSPRVFAPKKFKVKKNHRVIIREEGEVLGYISKVWRFGVDKIGYEKAPNGKAYIYDFFKNGAIGDHSIYGLARALLLMAAVNNEKTAIKNKEVTINNIKLAIEIQNNIAHCGFKFDENKTK